MAIDIKNTTGFAPKVDKATFQVSPYSPVFIGSGRKLKNRLDFFSSKRKTHIIDLSKLFHHQVDDLDAIESAIFKAEMPQYIRDSGLRIEDFIQRSYIGDSKSEELSVPLTDGFGNPIIPGSSIKGSIRSALLAHYLKKETEEKKLTDNEYLNLITRSDRNTSQRSALGQNNASRKLEERLLTTYRGRGQSGSAPNYDLGRVIRVGDSVFRPQDLEIFNIAVLNEVSNGYQWFVRREGRQSRNDPNLQNGTKIAVAGISYDPDTSKPSQVTISLDQQAAGDIGWKEKIDFGVIASACNATSRKVLQNDLEYMKDALSDQSMLSAVIDSIEELLELIDELELENAKASKFSWLQRIGWGSGYVSMTGAHTSVDMVQEIRKLYRLGREGFEYPKSRRISLDLDSKPATLMGWVLMEQL